MKIFDKDDKEMKEVNLSYGYIIEDKRLIKHHEGIPAQSEKFHYEVVAEYPNGGKDIKKVIDIEGIPEKPAWDEYEDIYRYIQTTPQEEVDDFNNLIKEQELRMQQVEAENKRNLLKAEQEDLERQKKLEEEQQRKREENNFTEAENTRKIEEELIKEQQQEQLNADRLNALEAAMCEVLGVQ